MLAELTDQVADVGEVVLEEERIGAASEHQIVAGLGLGLGRPLGRQLQMRDRVHADLAVRQLAERLGLLPELVVGGRDEVIPAEERQLTLLGEGGRFAKRKPGRHANGRAGGSAHELTTRSGSHRKTP